MKNFLISFSFFIIGAAVVYGVSSWIAWDYNPAHWLNIGRFFAIGWLIIIIGVIIPKK